MKLRFFEIAAKASRLSTHPDYQMGSVITRKNRVVSIGINSLKTHSKSSTPYKCIHAEFSAVLNAYQNDFSDCEIYVFRSKKDGSLGNARPCNHCENMIRNLNFKKFHYTHDEGYKTEKL